MEKKRKYLEAIARGIDGMDVVSGKSKTTPTYTKPTLPTKSTTKTKDTTTAADEALNLIYSGANATKANDYYKKAETPFEFSLDGNALYNQYKDQYTKQAQLAREDAIGKAAAMTGGYGSSYAMTAGDSAYNARMDELNNIIPELYNMAYNQHLNERNYNLEMGDRYASKDQAEMENYLAYLEAQNTTEKSKITDDMRAILSGLKTNKEISDQLNRWVAAGVITKEDGVILQGQYGKDESNWKTDEDGNYVDAKGNKILEGDLTTKGVLDYIGMMDNPEGWSSSYDGGFNWFWGMDRNAVLVMPTGEKIKVVDLFNKLKEQGMDGAVARSLIVKLQKNLGI